MAKQKPESLQAFAARMGLRKVNVDAGGMTLGWDYAYACSLSEIQDAIKNAERIGVGCLKNKPKKSNGRIK